MRTKNEIISKTNEIFEAAKEDFVSSRNNRFFKNCKHNKSLYVKKIGKINYCSLKTIFSKEEKNKLFICDTNEWSYKCSEFDCKNNRKLSEKEFMNIIKNPSRCGENFPKLSALLWVINDGDKETSLTVENTHRYEESKNKSILSFLKKIKSWFI